MDSFSVGVTSTESPVTPAWPGCPVKYIDQVQISSQGPMASVDLSLGGGNATRAYLREIVDVQALYHGEVIQAGSL